MASRNLLSDTKCCKRCNIEKLASEYYPHRRVCKDCHNAAALRHQNENPIAHRKNSAAFYVRHAERLRKAALVYKQENREKVLASARKTGRSRRLKFLGITDAHLNEAIEAQGGLCAVCRTREVHLNGGRQVHIDHCHQTGKFRGILCSGCNTAIGRLGDTLAGVEAAAKYLRGD